MAQDSTFNGGMLYTLLVTGMADAPVIIPGMTALNPQPGSVAGTPVAVEPMPEPTAVPEVTEAAPAPTEAPVATEAPASTAVPQAVAPTSGIIGLVYKSRLAAIALFLIFLIPLVLRMVQGMFPSTMLLIFSLILLYFFYSAILGTFSYQHLKNSKQDEGEAE